MVDKPAVEYAVGVWWDRLVKKCVASELFIRHSGLVWTERERQKG